MLAIANIVVGLIAFLSIFSSWKSFSGISLLDSVFFGQTQLAVIASKTPAANQGLYNGFLAAGLFWGLSQSDSGTDVKVFFLCCVFIAGVHGAATASRKIFFIQAVPAVVGLVLLVS